MDTAARPWMTAVLGLASAVETVPQALCVRIRIATRRAVQTVKTRTPRHHRYPVTAPHAPTPYVMLIASDITDQDYGIFS
jgi:hypothetical protein